MKLLDLYCGAGGSAVGYTRAGFEVVGVDIEPQPNYPYTLLQFDALQLDASWIRHCGYDAVHASPPCQYATDYQRTGVPYATGNLIPATRELLQATGLPYVIENVEKAARDLVEPVLLCGSMFDLDVQRHRLFETNWGLEYPWRPCRHKTWADDRYPGATNRNGRRTVEVGVWRIPLEVQQAAMGIDWMTLPELSEAVPPAYTEFIGEQLLARVQVPA